MTSDASKRAGSGIWDGNNCNAINPPFVAPHSKNPALR